jgi:cyclase
MEKITENVYVGNTFRGCTSSYVVTRDGVVMIDTPMLPSDARQLRDEIAAHGELRYVVNNEPHPDHVAGNCWLGSTVVAHETARPAVLALTRETLESQLSWMAPDALPLDRDFYWRPPDLTFSQDLTLYLGDHTFNIMLMPGHTPFETAVYVPEEKTVFTSDNVVQVMPIMFQCVPEWTDSLRRLLELDIEYVVRGHGEVGDKQAVVTMLENVEYCFAEVKKAIAAGWSAEEARERVTFAERFPPMPGDPMAGMRQEGIARLYEVLS